MRVFLIGMMGCGKTTLGHQLAALLNIPFIDLDKYIVAKAGKTISEIFTKEGEAWFRKLEREALEELVSKNEEAVIATGGGAPCFFDNVEFLNQHGENIYLDVPVSALLERLMNSDLRSRPLLANKSSDELRDFLINTLSQREGFYERAKFKVSGRQITAQQLQKLLNYN